MKKLSLILIYVLFSYSFVNAYSLEGMKYLSSDGGEKNIVDYKGKHLLIDFFATWCFPCNISIPQLKELYDYRSEVLNILSLSVDNETDTLRKISTYKESNAIPWEVGLDVNLSFVEYFNITVIPTFVLLDQEGRFLTYWNLSVIEDTKDHFEIVDRYIDVSGLSTYRKATYIHHLLIFIAVALLVSIKKTTQRYKPTL